MSSPNAFDTDRLSPRLSRTSISEGSSSYSHQTLPRRSHSERSQPRSSHHRSRDNDLPPLPPSEMPTETGRSSVTATDRKRRLTTSSHETGRRRTTTGGFTSRDNRFYHTPSRQSSHPSTSTVPDSTMPDIIDLTGSSPPASTRPSVPLGPTRTPSDNSRRYIVPHWQPDNEVSECPICRRQFTFLFRRHHCRKCGRVVCNECSPHRITIPRQYIVHPPGEEDGQVLDFNSFDLTRDDDDNIGQTGAQPRMSQALGGEKVRLCNPCVPDPQPELQAVFESSASRPLPPAPPLSNQHFAPFTPVSGFSRYSPQVLPPARPLGTGDQPLPHPGTRVHIDAEGEDDESGSSPETYHGSAGRHLVVCHCPLY